MYCHFSNSVGTHTHTDSAVTIVVIIYTVVVTAAVHWPTDLCHSGNRHRRSSPGRVKEHHRRFVCQVQIVATSSTVSRTNFT